MMGVGRVDGGVTAECKVESCASTDAVDAPDTEAAESDDSDAIAASSVSNSMFEDFCC